MAKLGHFRDILDENGYHFSGRRRMSVLVPFILAQEIDQEINGKAASITFDGTTY